MFTKVLMSASAVALISTAAYAQEKPLPESGHSATPPAAADASATRPQSSAHNPSTVNPPADVEAKTSIDPQAGKSHDDSLAAAAPAAADASADVSAISPDEARASGIAVETVASAPVPDTAENRAKYGAPMSRAGKLTSAKGN